MAVHPPGVRRRAQGHRRRLPGHGSVRAELADRLGGGLRLPRGRVRSGADGGGARAPPGGPPADRADRAGRPAPGQGGHGRLRRRDRGLPRRVSPAGREQAAARGRRPHRRRSGGHLGRDLPPDPVLRGPVRLLLGLRRARSQRAAGPRAHHRAPTRRAAAVHHPTGQARHHAVAAGPVLLPSVAVAAHDRGHPAPGGTDAPGPVPQLVGHRLPLQRLPRGHPRVRCRRRCRTAGPVGDAGPAEPRAGGDDGARAGGPERGHGGTRLLRRVLRPGGLPGAQVRARTRPPSVVLPAHCV